jgi:transcriptional regulator with XRE-family HTH domain
MKITPALTDAAVLSELGRRLERLRLERNITQETLAREAGISRRTLVRLERGEEAVGATTLLRVLRVLDLVDRVEQLVPEPLPSPIEELRSRGRRRQRATGEQRDASTTPWTWDEEETGE